MVVEKEWHKTGGERGGGDWREMMGRDGRERWAHTRERGGESEREAVVTDDSERW